MCTQLYLEKDTCTLAQRTIVCGDLHYMFVEHLSGYKIPYNSIYWFYTRIVLAHFESHMRCYEVLSMPTLDNFLALVLGAGHTIQTSDYTASWTMVSAASSMAQGLGSHRSTSSDHKHTVSRRILFWIIYYLDKCLFLRLRWSSTIQEYNIAIDSPREAQQPEYRSWVLWFHALMEITTAHGLIYERLYSPGSLRWLAD